MKLRKVKAQTAHESHFAEKGAGEPAVLRDPASTGSSMTDGRSLGSVRQMGSQEEEQGYLCCHDGIGGRAEAVKARSGMDGAP